MRNVIPFGFFVKQNAASFQTYSDIMWRALPMINAKCTGTDRFAPSKSDASVENCLLQDCTASDDTCGGAVLCVLCSVQAQYNEFALKKQH